ncbi:hypothetical protein LINPERHAP2_LOCUS16047 [Linum perenne]
MLHGARKIRRKEKLVWIANVATRKSSLEKRLQGLTTLCKIIGMCIVYTQVEEPILLLSHYLWRKYRQSTW